MSLSLDMVAHSGGCCEWSHKSGRSSHCQWFHAARDVILGRWWCPSLQAAKKCAARRLLLSLGTELLVVDGCRITFCLIDAALIPSFLHREGGGYLENFVLWWCFGMLVMLLLLLILGWSFRVKISPISRSFKTHHELCLFCYTITIVAIAFF